MVIGSSRAPDSLSGHKAGLHLGGAAGDGWTDKPFTIAAAPCGKEPMEMTRNTYEIPGQAGKLAVVTGARDGMGLQIATRLALAGADLALPVRNPGNAD